MRLLQVIADDLVELLTPAIEPAREPFVQLGPEFLRDAFIGGVAEQDVPEAEGVFDRLMRPDQFLADECGKLRPSGPAPVGGELAERLPLELEPYHGGT